MWFLSNFFSSSKWSHVVCVCTICVSFHSVAVHIEQYSQRKDSHLNFSLIYALYGFSGLTLYSAAYAYYIVMSRCGDGGDGDTGGGFTTFSALIMYLKNPLEYFPVHLYFGLCINRLNIDGWNLLIPYLCIEIGFSDMLHVRWIIDLVWLVGESCENLSTELSYHICLLIELKDRGKEKNCCHCLCSLWCEHTNSGSHSCARK